MSTGFLYDERYLLHHTADLPEQPERLSRLVEYLQSTGLLGRMAPLHPYAAPLEVVRLVHEEAYLNRIQEAVRRGETFVDSEEVQICADSWDVALLAAGGAMAACDAVMTSPAKASGAGRGVDNAFVAARPPGHHACRGTAMGFCLLNNVAIAARYVQQRYGLQRVAIVDWDLHHGNGTQDIFDDDASVLFVSLHEHPSFLYPGTGYAWEKGRGAGEGLTINVPMPPEADDADFQTAFANHVLPALRRFAPQFLLISAGFDAHADDPLGHLRLTSVGYAWMTRQLKNIAETYCQNRLVSILEGGYNTQSLSWSVAAHLEVLLEPTLEQSLMDFKSGMY